MEMVIALMMFLNSNGTPVLKEHLLMPDFKTCLAKKSYATRSSNAEYRCSRVNAVVKDGKIISISSLD